MPTFTKIPVDLERQVYDYVGTGSPATLLANAPVGATYRDLSGGSGSMLWQKTTASWEPLGSSSWNQALADTLYARLAASNTMTNGVPFFFNNVTSNWLLWSNAGVGAPTFTTRSVGTKLVLNPQLSGGAVDYALGVEGSFMWFSVPGGGGWKWYVNTSAMAILTSGGNFNINGSFVGAAITVGVATPATVILSGSPTNVQQIFMGDSSVGGAVGTLFSSGAAFHSYNAYQNTYNTDSWTQRSGGLPSTMLMISAGGIDVLSAVAGKAIGNLSTFWGSSKAYITAAGAIGGIGVLRMGTQGTNGTTGDIIAARNSTTGAYYYGNSGSAYTYFDGTWLNLGADFVGLVMGNLHTGIVGQYDATKYRAVYSMGTAFTPPAGGTALTGMYGLTFFYDATSGGHNVSGFSFGHALGLVDNGVITCFMSTLGFWTSGNIRAGGGLVVTGQITGGSMIITGASTLGSATIGGYAIPAVRSGSATSIPGDLVAGQMYFGY